jgi:flavin-dependent dehydrogenase
MPHDVLIVGGGPAGAVAGIVAARGGARVRILDRAVFPRDKLCGDTLNPGAMAILRRLGVASAVEGCALRVDGMLVTGEGGVAIHGRYPGGLSGCALSRRDLDAILLQAAADAGCDVACGVTVREPVVDGAGRVSGVVVAARDGASRLGAPVVIGADGRRSALAFALGLARHPRRPRRWAVGAYLTGVIPQSRAERVDSGSDPNDRICGSHCNLGEMHVRRNGYIGIAAAPGDLTNVCVVREANAGDLDFRDPSDLLMRTLGSDPQLAARFTQAALATRPVVLGPLAVDACGTAVDGLFLAGDAAGFIDPMTGDGLRFAFRGGELAADAALRVLAEGWRGAHDRLAAARADAFAGKWRFNRVLRALVASPRAVSAAGRGARIAPAVLRAVIARAGDCHLAA